MLGVDVRELLDVEERRRRVDVLEPEQLDDLADRPDLDAVGRAPAQQRQVVAHGLGQEAPVAVVADGHVVATLGQLLALLVDEERQVGEDRADAEAERLGEQQVLGGAVDVLLAPDDVGDGHDVVVDDVGEEERRGAVRPQQHEVLDAGVLEADVAARPGRRTRWCRRRGCGTAAPARRPTRAARGRGRSRRSPGGPPRRLGPLLDLLRGAVAPVGPPGGARACRPPPRRASSRSDWWTGLPVPVEAEPPHGVEDGLDQLGPVALGVGVLDPQQELAALVAGEQPVEQHRAGAADVEVARRRRGEADTDGVGRHPVKGTRCPKALGSGGPDRCGGASRASRERQSDGGARP